MSDDGEAANPKTEDRSRAMYRLEWNRHPLAPLTTTMDDTARILGLPISVVRDLIAKEELKTARVGGRKLVFIASIHELLDRATDKPNRSE